MVHTLSFFGLLDDCVEIRDQNVCPFVSSALYACITCITYITYITAISSIACIARVTYITCMY